MKSLVILFLIVSLNFSLFAQDTCFDSCWSRFDSSEVPFLQKNKEILGQLVGCKAPDFVMNFLDNKSTSLRKLEGKIVLLSFWFAACPGCISQLPALNRLSDEYNSNSNVVFVALGRDSEDVVHAFLRKHQFNYNHSLSSDELKRAYCILNGWPMNLVIDKQGIVRYIRSGGPIEGMENDMIPYHDMKPVIDMYLK